MNIDYILIIGLIIGVIFYIILAESHHNTVIRRVFYWNNSPYGRMMNKINENSKKNSQ